MFFIRKICSKFRSSRFAVRALEATLLIITIAVWNFGASAGLIWADQGTSIIHTANADGTDVQNLITLPFSPIDVKVNSVDNKIYWTSFGDDGSIQRANLDGSNVEDIIATGLSMPWGLTIDNVNGKIYWTDVIADKIQRANLDGSNVEDVITTGLASPSGIALDLINGWLPSEILKLS